MKRLGMLLLLISLGLNVGLVVKLREADRAPRHAWERGEQRRGLRPAFDDSAGWRAVIDRRLDRLADRLGLDPGQREAFASLQDSAGRAMRERRRGIAEAQERVAALAADGAVDTAELKRALHMVRARQAAMDSLAGEFMLRELDVLRPEQRAEYLRLLPLEHGPGHGRDQWSPRGRRGTRRGNNPG